MISFEPFVTFVSNPAVLYSYFAVIVCWRIWCAITINHYADRYTQNFETTLVLFGRFIWIILGLSLGIVGVALFWACHHSTLNPLVALKIQRHTEPSE